VENDELLRACRPGSPADGLLAAALGRGEATDEYADTGDLDHEGDAEHLARIYARRVRHLAVRGMLLVDEVSTLADLDAFRATSQAGGVVIRTERGNDGRTVYTALVAGRPPRIGACLVHQLPG
jgi:hypothetical protein